jgi:hypothetical protein
MAKLSADKRQQIVNQALQEIEFNRRYKQGKIPFWQKNEDLYYGKETPQLETRANIGIESAQMQMFVNTIWSKIDDPLTFKFAKRKNSQIKRVARLNALRKMDQDRDFWDLKDLAGKKQAIIYGRAVYSYFADSFEGYAPHLDPVDVYDFLIDPAGGGLDMERAKNLGRYGVIKERGELEDGMRAGLYDRTQTTLLLSGSGNAIEMPQEELNKRNRTLDTNVWIQNKESGIDHDKYKFWEWFTTFDGERYYLLLTERGGTAIVVENLQERQPATKSFPLGAYPFWSWAPFIDLTEFWSPSYCDYARRIFNGQGLSINQAVDNSERINFPQKAVDVGAIMNLAELKYRRNGYIQFKKGTDVNKAMQTVVTPAIDTPLKVFDKLDAIQEKASGVTANAKGSSTDTKVGIYEGNQAAEADRYGLLNKSYSAGYKRFAQLYEMGVRHNLTQRTAIDILGIDGIEIENITSKDIFRKDDTFATLVESSAAETQMSQADKKDKITYLQMVTNAPSTTAFINKRKSIALQGEIAGLQEDEIDQLLDTSMYGTSAMIADADQDIEAILDGKEVKPRMNANNAYMERIVSFMGKQKDDIKHDKYMKLAEYVKLITPYVVSNSEREAQKEASMMLRQAGAPTQPTAGINGVSQ